MKIIVIGTVAASILNFRKHLILSMLAEGHEVYAFATDYNVGQIKIIESWGAFPVKYELARTGLNPIQDIWCTIKLSLKIRKIRPDLVFSYFSKPVIYGTIAAKIAGVKKSVAMLEGLGFLFTSQPHGVTLKTKILQKIQVYLYRLVFPYLDTLLFLNHDDPIDLLVANNMKVNNYKVIGGIGLDLNDYPYCLPSLAPVRFLFMGRLLVEKGIFEFIEAAKIVKEKKPNIEFIVLGEVDNLNPGSLSKYELKKYIESGLLFHPGHVDDVCYWINNSSVFVLPSYREGISRSTQEAMAIGRPIITTDAPGCRETVIDGKNGYLIPPWSPKILADKMLWFIDHPEEITKMGLCSRKIAEERYDVHKINSHLLDILGLR
jgi:glycosyltransferase involved in cell wall biosynthesis